MFKHSPNGEGMIYGPIGMYHQWKRHYGTNIYIPSLKVPMEGAWFYEEFFFEVVVVMLKDKKNRL